MGVNILNINPSTIKVRNQYVECCCTEDEQTTLLRKLMKVEGVTDVMIIPEPESLGNDNSYVYLAIQVIIMIMS